MLVMLDRPMIAHDGPYDGPANRILQSATDGANNYPEDVTPAYAVLAYS